MPIERAARDDFLAAAGHLRKLMAVIDKVDALIECGWLSEEQAVQVSVIREFLASGQQNLETAVGNMNFLLPGSRTIPCPNVRVNYSSGLALV